MGKLLLTIRAKLIIIFTILTLFSVGSISAIVFYESRKILKERIFSDFAALVRAKKELIELSLQDDIKTLYANSSRRLPRGYLAKIISRAPDLEEAKKEAFKTLKDAMNSEPSIRSIDVLDASGKLMISTDAGSVGKDFAGSRLLLEGLKGLYVGDTYLDKGILMMDIAAPTYNPFKETLEAVGVFKTTIDESKLIKFLENHRGLGNTGEVLLAKRSGDDIVYINTLRHANNPPLSLSMPFNTSNAIPMKAALDRNLGIIIGKDYRGRTVLAATDYVELAGWGLVGKIDLDEAMSPIDKLLASIILTAVFIFIFSSIAVVIFARFLTRPIEKMNTMAGVIAKGDFNSRLDISRTDEIGQLADSINDMVVNLRNITISRDQLNEEVIKRSKTEEELKKAYDDLRKIQNQLVQSSKMAAIGQLAGGIAHEINNPLTGVLNNAQLIKMQLGTCKPEAFKDLLDAIEESALRCKKITQSLLDFSHASKEEFQEVDLNILVEKVTKLILVEMKLGNIKIHTFLQPGLPSVKGDSQLLQQVLVGLIANSKWAIDKKNTQKGVITIKTHKDQDSNSVVLEVSDNGIGILKENMPKLFEPFFTTKDVGEGTGLGLPLIYGIVRNHGGNIKIESQANEWTLAKITLPVV